MPKRTEARTTTTGQRPQLTLPRQSHTAEGPYDQTGMYVMHHALRRDFVHFVAAVQNTPVSEHEVWTALEQRWDRFADILHHHHTAEDDHLWPVLLQARGAVRVARRTCSCWPTWRPSTRASVPP